MVDTLSEPRSSIASCQLATRGRYLGGKVLFGFRRGDDDELVSHEAEQEAIREWSRYAQGKALRAIAKAVRGKAIESATRAWQAS